MPGPGEQVVDLGAAVGRQHSRPATRTAPASPFPNDGENPYASSPLSVPPSASPRVQSSLYAIPGVFLLLFSGAGLAFGGLYLFLLVVGGVGMAGPAELLMLLLIMVTAGLSHGLTLAGSLQMIQRRNLLLARIGAWAALYPCGMCSILQVPFAIWALVLLYRANAPADFSLTVGGHSARGRDELLP